MKTTLKTLTLGLVAGSIAAPAFAQEISFWSWRQEDRAVYQQIIDAFQAANPVMYVQQKADLSGEDLGMVFLNGEYICTYARVSQSGAWNTTIHSGGKYAPFDPSPELIELGRRAQAPFGLTFTTVDIALTPEGPIVFEV